MGQATPVPSSRMTLSPNILTSNSRFARRRFNMFLLGLLLALTSKAHTPMRPKGAGFAVGLVSSAAHELHRSVD
jgi:hypothetical protein